jgi:sugar O-acyltransferase (sialic acid O-acetyltransferase NeuD family)
MLDRTVVIIGTGGHARVVIDLLHKLGRTVQAAVEVSPPTWDRHALEVPVKGDDAAVLAYDPNTVELALGIGMPSAEPVAGLGLRLAIAAHYAERGYRFPPLVHPSAIIGSECSIGDGAQIMAGAILQAGCSVGHFAIVNTGACVDHDCVLGVGCHIAPRATLGGSVKVGTETLVGIGATVRQGIVIGDRSLIGGGAMVVVNIDSGEQRAGVPARLRNFRTMS